MVAHIISFLGTISVLAKKHSSEQYPQFPSVCIPNLSTFVEHQNLPSGSLSVVQASNVWSPIVNGNWHEAFFELDPGSFVVLHVDFLWMLVKKEQTYNNYTQNIR